MRKSFKKQFQQEKFGVVPFPKTCFSMAGVPELMAELVSTL
jgi:hypothetical protein